MTVFWDLIWGVLAGMFVANLLTVDSITQVQLEKIDEENPLEDTTEPQQGKDLNKSERSILNECQGEVMLFCLKGPLSFGAAKGISARMSLVQNYKVLILDISDVPHIGVTATLAIERMVQEANGHQRTAFVAGAKGKVMKRLKQFGVDNLVASRLDALKQARMIISEI